ncbi:uncharacterized protein TA03935 [Theileria annulata]|uniref:Uncharacterized protein n=1 Tax=Theileria annulata TaxID=5874 RepID=Q4UCB8_THEAN|nr:uncharacterized protein TA03935 [Theileria annulata]CAI75533.1 hypothetical protein, conserved [Theileria annulata]|eukprot:XP_955009.1 hypothetical protein, conserved [Theileria annulata]
MCIEKVDMILNNQDYINNELKDQLYKFGQLNNLFSNQTNHTILYNENTIKNMEAPVIYLEPPLILPKEQIKIDTEVEKFLKDSGLEIITKDMSNDPLHILNIDEVKISEKVIKSKIKKLENKRKELFEKLRKLSLESENITQFNLTNQNIKQIDKLLKNEIEKLTQIELTKKTLINKGPGIDMKNNEINLENKELEIEQHEDGGDEGENEEGEETEENNQQDDSDDDVD